MFIEKEYVSDWVFDMAEYYRQNYEDALDEINNLRYRIAELEAENKLLNESIDRAENFIYHHI
jgi:hypothetical protein